MSTHDREAFDYLGQIYASLSDERKLRALELIRQGTKSAKEIAEEVDTSRPGLQKWLDAYRALGFIVLGEGRNYKITENGSRALEEFVYTHLPLAKELAEKKLEMDSEDFLSKHNSEHNFGYIEKRIKELRAKTGKK